MKTRSFHSAVCLSAAVLLLSACGPKESEPAPPQSEAPRPSTTATPAAQPPAADTVTAVATGTLEVVKSETAAAANKVQSLIDQAKTLVSEKKWAEALQLLGTLAEQELTSDQETAVQNLQEQAQQGAASSLKTDAQQQATDAANKLLAPGR